MKTVLVTQSLPADAVRFDEINKNDYETNFRMLKETGFSLYGLGGLPSLPPINNPDIIAHIKGLVIIGSLEHP